MSFNTFAPLAMHPRDLLIQDFDYVLPQDRIAQFPLEKRDDSKLLIYQEATLTQDGFQKIPTHLPENATLVFNDTKVIHARILFTNSNNATIEVFLLEPVTPYSDMQLAIFHHGKTTWRCMIGNVKKWREEVLVKTVRMNGEEVLLEARVKGRIPVSDSDALRKEEDFLVEFSWDDEKISFARMIESAGYVPLPPYIKRRTISDDEDRYQTIYATQDGSVAAPTAGLHFTDYLLKRLKNKKIQFEFVTLHVGAGTFLPVKSPTMSEHHMHQEQIVVRKSTIEKLQSAIAEKERDAFPIVAVGTTALRTLESLYWLGKRINEGDRSLSVDQWEPYNSNPEPGDAKKNLHTLLDYMSKEKVNQVVAATRLLIAPGYDFKIVDGLITNFHLPKSTLLLLIAAFIGDDWKGVYDYALKNNFRFLSYGDGSLLWKK